MTQILDARGLSCPQPLILTTRAMRQAETAVDVLVDDVVARENILRMLSERYGLTPEVRTDGPDFCIQIRRDAS